MHTLSTSTSTDAGATTPSVTGADLDLDRRCRSSPGEARPSNDLRPQRDVRSLPGHVTPPSPWSDRSTMTPSEEATRRGANFRFLLPRPEVVSFSENRAHDRMASCSSAADDVFVASPDETANEKHFFADATEKSASVSVKVVTSFPASTKPPYSDVIDRPRIKSAKRHTLELDLSAPSSHRRRSLSKPVSLVRRKSTSCCELSAVPQVDRETRKSAAADSPAPSPSASAAARRPPVLQLQLGQKFSVVCRQTKTGTSFALVNVESATHASSSSSSSSTMNAEKRSEPRDFNDNTADDGEDRQTGITQTETAHGPSRGNTGRTIVEQDCLGVDVGRIAVDDVIRRRSPSNTTSSSSFSRERQLIFV